MVTTGIGLFTILKSYLIVENKASLLVDLVLFKDFLSSKCIILLIPLKKTFFYLKILPHNKLDGYVFGYLSAAK